MLQNERHPTEKTKMSHILIPNSGKPPEKYLCILNITPYLRDNGIGLNNLLYPNDLSRAICGRNIFVV